MNKIKYYVSLLGVVALVSCSDHDRDIMYDGNLFIAPNYIGEVRVVEVENQSRAGDDSEEPVYTYTTESLQNSTILWISNGDGVIRKFNGLSTFPTGGERLTGGFYFAEAWAGDSVSASWTARYYKAAQDFSINGDVNLNLDLKLANVFASVVIDESIDKVLTDYKVTVYHSRGSKTFEGKDTRVASFMMPTNWNAGEDDSPKEDVLKWKMTGTEITGDLFVKEGVIDHVSAGHQYILTFSHKGSTPSIGGAFIGLEIKDLNLITQTNYIVQPPTIQRASGVSITRPILVPKGKQQDNVYVEIGAVGEFYIVELSGQLVSSLLSDNGSVINFVGASEERLNLLESKGLTATGYNDGTFYDANKNLSSMRLTFTPELINNLDNGTYEVNIYVMDDGKGDNSDNPYKRESRATLTIIVSEEIVIVNIPDMEDYCLPEKRNVTPTSVRLTGIVTDESAEFTGVGMQYRVRGADAWNRIEPVNVSRASDSYEFFIDGLQPNTTIEYRTVWTKAGNTAESASSVQTITTATNKIPNGDFEDWNTSNKATLMYNKTSMFWDSGNHGSSTMNKNVTSPDSNVKHGGSYSAKLQSQFVGVAGIGKFAAGNAFVGEYLETSGTDGVLGWGRPFYYKPKGLKGFVKYTPGTVKYTDSGAPDIVNGQSDKGIIYIALLTDDMNAQGDNSNANRAKYPVVVRTKASERQLFNPKGANVIAYGELVFDKATDGNAMVEFNIPLEYYESMKDENVCYLLLVCSASKGGDYFAGGDSVMYLDDFELVY